MPLAATQWQQALQEYTLTAMTVHRLMTSAAAV